MQFIRSNLTATIGLTGLVIAAIAAGCGPQLPAAANNQPTQGSLAETIVVKVVHPEKRNVQRMIERPGYNIEAFERTLVHAKIPGYVQKWNVDMGKSVRKDDILAELYIPEMDVELAQKEAVLRQSTSEVEQAQAAKIRATAELKRAESQYQRLAHIGRSGVLDKEQVDEARFGFEAAQATVAKADADVNVARARVDVAKADRDRVQTLLQYTKVRAPFDGVVTERRTINTGDFVQPPGANKGEALFIVERIKPVRVFVNVPEQDASWVQEGDLALIRAHGLQGQQFQGHVTRVSKSLNPQNRTLRTEIDLPNDDGRLLPGMFVNVTIKAEHKNVWALPATAVLTEGEHTFCYRVENDKAFRTPIQVGMRGSEWVEVLKKGKPAEERAWEEITGQEGISLDGAGLSEGQAVQTTSARK
jgi:multidrug efflux pump subunit AcrA (membrane-fusion protein)